MKLRHPLAAWASATAPDKGHHEWLVELTLRAATAQPDFEKALAWCRRAADKFSRRPRQRNEIANLLKGAYQAVRDPRPHTPRAADSPSLRTSHRGREGDLDALRLSSDLTVTTAGQAVLSLFEPRDWICVLKHVDEPSFDFAQNWAADPTLGQYQFIVANAFEENTSSRRLEGIKKRRLIVHESDASNWDAEAQIGPIMKLGEIFPLQAVVWSAGKSLHAWYVTDDCARLPDFIQLSTMLGGDHKCHAPNHPVRLPLGLRPGKGRQELIYAKKQ